MGQFLTLIIDDVHGGFLFILIVFSVFEVNKVFSGFQFSVVFRGFQRFCLWFHSGFLWFLRGFKGFYEVLWGLKVLYFIFYRGVFLGSWVFIGGFSGIVRVFFKFLSVFPGFV